MTSINNQQQQNKILYQTIAEFLEKTPPNQLTQISDLLAPEYVGGQFRYYSKLNTPTLELYCPQASCARTMNFRCIDISDGGNQLTADTVSYFYVTYRCSNCREEERVFSLIAMICENGKPQGECYKFGELPPYGPMFLQSLLSLLAPRATPL